MHDTHLSRPERSACRQPIPLVELPSHGGLRRTGQTLKRQYKPLRQPLLHLVQIELRGEPPVEQIASPLDLAKIRIAKQS